MVCNTRQPELLDDRRRSERDSPDCVWIAVAVRIPGRVALWQPELIGRIFSTRVVPTVWLTVSLKWKRNCPRHGNAPRWAHERVGIGPELEPAVTDQRISQCYGRVAAERPRFS